MTDRLAGPRDLAALAALTGFDAAPAALVRRHSDTSTRQVLKAAGFTRGFVERFFRPFLSGVFLEEDLATSGRFFHLLWRTMARGTLCLPETGVGAVPELLASTPPPGTVALESSVTALTDEGALLGDGRTVPARTVVGAHVRDQAGLAAGTVPQADSERSEERYRTAVRERLELRYGPGEARAVAEAAMRAAAPVKAHIADPVDMALDNVLRFGDYDNATLHIPPGPYDSELRRGGPFRLRGGAGVRHCVPAGQLRPAGSPWRSGICR